MKEDKFCSINQKILVSLGITNQSRLAGITMSYTTRYRICLTMMWVQIYMLPLSVVIGVMPGSGQIWRWDLNYWILIIGYVLGLLALPAGAGLDKPKLLKWWLRIDFAISLLFAIPYMTMIYACMPKNIVEKDDYILYSRGGIMACPVAVLGEKNGLFIKETPVLLHLFTAGSMKPEDFTIDKNTGSCYGICTNGDKDFSWCCPLDSAVYNANSVRICAILDSIWHCRLKTFPSGLGYFVFPEDFSAITYSCNSIDYAERYIDYHPYDDRICQSVVYNMVKIYDRNGDDSLLPIDSIKWMSPTVARDYMNNLMVGNNPAALPDRQQ